MTQTIIVILIVAAAVFFAVRRLLRTVKRKDGGCGCGCSGCPYRGECNKKEADT
ncbi:MAG: FeoB-associated Cys-rich membrane protein [Bacteroidales bacterium]|nr:FeoB-associated Cys-rich membrane protein [Bacteroidales bacterium]